MAGFAMGFCFFLGTRYGVEAVFPSAPTVRHCHLMFKRELLLGPLCLKVAHRNPNHEEQNPSPALGRSFVDTFFRPHLRGDGRQGGGPR